MTKHAGIIGHPLGHSASPVFQQAAFDALGLDCRYERWETPPDELAERFEMLRDAAVLGANVTVPHKLAALALVDEVDPVASSIGAVNTVVRHEGGRLAGHNTDAAGFVQSLRLDAGFDPAGCRAAIIGAGGAARAVAFGLAEAGARELVILNRTQATAQELAEAVRKATAVGAIAGALDRGGDDPSPTEPPELVVNCTSIGMRGGPAEGAVLEAAHLVSETTLVCDLVYNPLETPLLRLAQARGARTLNGLGMLVRQGAAAFTLWTGREAPFDVMNRAARRALGHEADS